MSVQNGTALIRFMWVQRARRDSRDQRQYVLARRTIHYAGPLFKSATTRLQISLPCPLYFSIHHRSRSHTLSLSLLIQDFLPAQARDRRVYHLQHRCDKIATTREKKSRVFSEIKKSSHRVIRPIFPSSLWYLYLSFVNLSRHRSTSAVYLAAENKHDARQFCIIRVL